MLATTAQLERFERSEEPGGQDLILMIRFINDIVRDHNVLRRTNNDSTKHDDRSKCKI